MIESVIEAFVLKGLNSTVIKKHVDKLVNKYDTGGNRHNFILVYAKSPDFESLWQQYQSCFDDFVNDKESYTTKQSLRVGTAHSGKTEVIHLFIDFYSPEKLKLPTI